MSQLLVAQAGRGVPEDLPLPLAKTPLEERLVDVPRPVGSRLVLHPCRHHVSAGPDLAAVDRPDCLNQVLGPGTFGQDAAGTGRSVSGNAEPAALSVAWRESTGPRTAAGLERSRRARWRHGVYSRKTLAILAESRREVSVGIGDRASRAPARKHVVTVSREGLEQLQDGDRLGRQRNNEGRARALRRSTSLLS